MVLAQRLKYGSMENKSPQIDPHLHVHLLFTKSTETIQEAKEVFLTNSDG